MPLAHQPTAHRAERAQTHLGEVDGGDGVVVEELCTVYEEDAAKGPLIVAGRALGGHEADEDLCAEAAGVALLAARGLAGKDAGCGNAELEGCELCGGEELGGGGVEEGVPGNEVPSCEATVEGDGGALVGCSGEG